MTNSSKKMNCSHPSLKNLLNSSTFIINKRKILKNTSNLRKKSFSILEVMKRKGLMKGNTKKDHLNNIIHTAALMNIIPQKTTLTSSQIAQRTMPFGTA